MITVLGATGTQGGAVVRALTGGEFTVRAVTRNAASPKAQALARRGAHVVEATLTDEGSLRRAFDGAYGTDTAKNKHHKPHGSATPPRTSTVASPSPSVPTAPP